MAEESIREQILQDAEADVAAIDGTGSYHLAVQTCARLQGRPSNLDALPAVHLAEGTEGVVDGPNPLISRTLRLTARAWVRADDLNPVLATLQNRMHADLERALLADPTRGGLALDTRLAGSRILEDLEPGICGEIEVQFDIRYRTRYNDPAQGL